ncbi:hypothetical protein C8R48DRAFT_708349 [Suillus tomentosus]|nr:hypothetical protein C8R48DRAFT_708349 [Suillus tomentosus]
MASSITSFIQVCVKQRRGTELKLQRVTWRSRCSCRTDRRHSGYRGIEMALHWVDEAEGHQYDSALDAYQVCLGLFDNRAMTRSSIISGCNCLAAFDTKQF